MLLRDGPAHLGDDLDLLVAGGAGGDAGPDRAVYMRRVTNTVNHSSTMPLAQGERFDI